MDLCTQQFVQENLPDGSICSSQVMPPPGFGYGPPPGLELPRCKVRRNGAEKLGRFEKCDVDIGRKTLGFVGTIWYHHLTQFH